MTRPFAIPFALAAAACAQTLVEPERAAEIRQAFDQPLAAMLRCGISPVKPFLTFGFRFQTGYQLTFPLSQFSGSGHRISIHVRVVPAGLPPVYLTVTKGLPNVPDVKADAAEDGMFVVGEGSYSVDLLAVDDEHRSCRSTWQIQARLNGTERQVVPATPPLTIFEAASSTPPGAPKQRPDIGRLTILLHAAPMMPRRTKLQEDDINLLTDSVSTLLRQWPARSVRLIAFNLLQRSVIVRKDKFDASQMNDLTQSLEQVELGAVNYRTLASSRNPLDLMSNLVQEELRDLPDAVLILGPQAALGENLPPEPGKRLEPTPIFYLQYPPGRVLFGQPGFASAQPIGSAGVRGPGNLGPDNLSSLSRVPISMATADGIQKLVVRLKGEIFPVRSPHDLADAIRRIDPRIARTAAPAEAAPTPELDGAKITPPELPPDAPPPKPAQPSATDADPIDVLAALRDRLLEHGQTVPNHTCVETVNRSRFEHSGQAMSSCDAVLAGRRQMGAGARLRLATTDRLRLDVALSTEREIYSWAGANHFEDRDIDEIVPRGAMGTGPFAGFLLSVFIGRPPRFVFEGETTLNGRTVYEYSFDVPKPESHFRFKAHKEWLITAYSGNIFVDPKTSDLVRLVVRSDELPPETETCEVDTTLDYGKVQLNGGLFFLPSSTTQTFVGRDSEVSENVYTFSSCRDFHAESTIDYGDHADDHSTKTGSPAATFEWPAGLPVLIEVTDTIDSATAAAGDRIRGRVFQTVRDQKGRTIVAEGTPVTGRLMRVEVRHPSPQVTIALRWETIGIGGQELPVALMPRHPVRPGSEIQLGGVAAIAGLKRRGVEFELPLPGEERFGVYHFSGEHVLVESGLKTGWVTAKP
jgi:hypothetical protein